MVKLRKSHNKLKIALCTVLLFFIAAGGIFGIWILSGLIGVHSDPMASDFDNDKEVPPAGSTYSSLSSSQGQSLDGMQILSYLAGVLEEQEYYHAYALCESEGWGIKQYTATFKDYRKIDGTGVMVASDLTWGDLPLVNSATQSCFVLGGDGAGVYMRGSSGRVNSNSTATTPNWNLTEPAYYDDALKEERDGGYYFSYGHYSTEMTVYLLSSKENTVESWSDVEVVDAENGIYSQTYVLDSALATSLYRYAMMTRGGLKSLPTFESIELTVIFDDNFRVLQTIADEKSNINKIGPMESTSVTTTSFYYGEDEFDEAHFDYYYSYYSQYVGELSQGGNGGSGEVDAVEMLMSAFNELLYGEGQQFDATLTLGGSQYYGRIFLNIDMDGINAGDIVGSIEARVALSSDSDFDGQDLYIEFVNGEVNCYYSSGFALTVNIDEFTEVINKFEAWVADSFGSSSGGAGGVNAPAAETLSSGDDILSKLLGGLSYTVNDDGTAVFTLAIDDLFGISLDAQLNFTISEASDGTLIYNFVNAEIAGISFNGEPVSLSAELTPSAVDKISHEKSETPFDLSDAADKIYAMLGSESIKVELSLKGEGLGDILNAAGVSVGEALDDLALTVGGTVDVDGVKVSAEVKLYSLSAETEYVNARVFYVYDGSSGQYGTAYVNLISLMGRPVDVKVYCNIADTVTAVESLIETVSGLIPSVNSLSTGGDMTIADIINGVLSIDFGSLIKEVSGSSDGLSVVLNADEVLALFADGIEFGDIELSYNMTGSLDRDDYVGAGGWLHGSVAGLGAEAYIYGSNAKTAFTAEGYADITAFIENIDKLIQGAVDVSGAVGIDVLVKDLQTGTLLDDYSYALGIKAVPSQEGVGALVDFAITSKSGGDKLLAFTVYYNYTGESWGTAYLQVTELLGVGELDLRISCDIKNLADSISGLISAFSANPATLSENSDGQGAAGGIDALVSEAEKLIAAVSAVDWNTFLNKLVADMGAVIDTVTINSEDFIVGLDVDALLKMMTFTADSNLTGSLADYIGLDGVTLTYMDGMANEEAETAEGYLSGVLTDGYGSEVLTVKVYSTSAEIAPISDCLDANSVVDLINSVIGGTVETEAKSLGIQLTLEGLNTGTLLDDYKYTLSANAALSQEGAGAYAYLEISEENADPVLSMAVYYNYDGVIGGSSDGEKNYGSAYVNITWLLGVSCDIKIKCDIAEVAEAVQQLISSLGLDTQSGGDTEQTSAAVNNGEGTAQFAGLAGDIEKLAEKVTAIMKAVNAVEWEDVLTNFVTDMGGVVKTLTVNGRTAVIGIDTAALIDLFGISEDVLSLGKGQFVLSYNGEPYEGDADAVDGYFSATLSDKNGGTLARAAVYASRQEVRQPEGNYLDITAVIDEVTAAAQAVQQIITAKDAKFDIDAAVEVNGTEVRIEGDGEVVWNEDGAVTDIALSLVLSVSDGSDISYNTFDFIYDGDASDNAPYIRLAVNGYSLDISRDGVNSAKTEIERITAAIDALINGQPQDGADANALLSLLSAENEGAVIDGGNDGGNGGTVIPENVLAILETVFGILGGDNDIAEALSGIFARLLDGATVTIDELIEAVIKDVAEISVGVNNSGRLVLDGAAYVNGNRAFTVSAGIAAGSGAFIDELGTAFNGEDYTFGTDNTFIGLVYDFVFDALDSISIGEYLGDNTYQVELVLNGAESGIAALEGVKVDATLYFAEDIGTQDRTGNGNLVKADFSLEIDGFTLSGSIAYNNSTLYLEIDEVYGVQLATEAEDGAKTGLKVKLSATDIKTAVSEAVAFLTSEDLLTVVNNFRGTDEIALGKKELSLDFGDSLQLSAALADAYKDLQIKWSSSNDAVATVDQSGCVTAVGGGEAVISASIVTEAGDKYAAVCTVNVNAPITLNMSSLSLNLSKDTESVLTAKVISAYKDAVVEWTSDNEEVATVDQSGKVKAIGAGSANITAKITTSGGVFTSVCSVTVEKNDILASLLEALTTLRFGDFVNIDDTQSGVYVITADVGYVLDMLGLEKYVGVVEVTAKSDNSIGIKVTRALEDSESADPWLTLGAGKVSGNAAADFDASGYADAYGLIELLLGAVNGEHAVSLDIMLDNLATGTVLDNYSYSLKAVVSPTLEDAGAQVDLDITDRQDGSALIGLSVYYTFDGVNYSDGEYGAAYLTVTSLFGKECGIRLYCDVGDIAASIENLLLAIENFGSSEVPEGGSEDESGEQQALYSGIVGDVQNLSAKIEDIIEIVSAIDWANMLADIQTDINSALTTVKVNGETLIIGADMEKVLSMFSAEIEGQNKSLADIISLGELEFTYGDGKIGATLYDGKTEGKELLTAEICAAENIPSKPEGQFFDLTKVIDLINSAVAVADGINEAQAVEFTVDSTVTVNGTGIGIVGGGEVMWNADGTVTSLALSLTLSAEDGTSKNKSSTKFDFIMTNSADSDEYITLAVGEYRLDISRADIDNFSNQLEKLTAAFGVLTGSSTVEEYNAVLEQIANDAGLSVTSIEDGGTSSGGISEDTAALINVLFNELSGDGILGNLLSELLSGSTLSIGEVVLELSASAGLDKFFTVTDGEGNISLAVGGSLALGAEDGRFTLSGTLSSDGAEFAEISASAYAGGGSYTSALRAAVAEYEGVSEGSLEQMVYEFIFGAIEKVDISTFLGGKAYEVQLKLAGDASGIEALEGIDIDATLYFADGLAGGSLEKGKLLQADFDIDISGFTVSATAVYYSGSFYISIDDIGGTAFDDLNVKVSANDIYSAVENLIAIIENPDILSLFSEDPEDAVIELNVSELSLDIKENTSASLAANVGSAYADYTVVWASDKEEVATVDQSGNVTAKGVGEANITASIAAADGKTYTASCAVSVASEPAGEGEVTLAGVLTTLLTMDYKDVVTIVKAEGSTVITADIDKVLAAIGITQKVGVAEISVSSGENKEISVGLKADSAYSWLELKAHRTEKRVIDSATLEGYLDIGFAADLVEDAGKFVTSNKVTDGGGTEKLSTLYTFYDDQLSIALNVSGIVTANIRINNVYLTAGLDGNGHFLLSLRGEMQSANATILGFLPVSVAEANTIGITFSYSESYGDYLITLFKYKDNDSSNPIYWTMTLNYFLDHIFASSGDSSDSPIRWLTGMSDTLWNMVAGSLAEQFPVSSGLADPDELYLYDASRGIAEQTVISIFDYLLGYAADGKTYYGTNAVNTALSNLGMSDSSGSYLFSLDADNLTDGILSALDIAVTRSQTTGIGGLNAYASIGGMVNISASLVYRAGETPVDDYLVAAEAKAGGINYSYYNGANDSSAEYADWIFGCAWVEDTVTYDYSETLVDDYVTVNVYDADGSTLLWTEHIRYGSTIYLYDLDNPEYVEVVNEDGSISRYAVIYVDKNNIPADGDYSQCPETVTATQTEYNFVKVQTKNEVISLTLYNVQADGSLQLIDDDYRLLSGSGLPSSDVYGGYTLLNGTWYSDAACEQVYTAGTGGLTENVTLYGRFVRSSVTKNGVVYTFVDEQDGVEAHYEITGHTNAIAAYYDANTTLVLENTIDGYPVTKITAEALKNDSSDVQQGLKNVVVPENITYIGGRAFLDNYGMISVVFLADSVCFANDVTADNNSQKYPFYGCTDTPDGETRSLHVYYKNATCLDENGSETSSLDGGVFVVRRRSGDSNITAYTHTSGWAWIEYDVTLNGQPYTDDSLGEVTAGLPASGILLTELSWNGSQVSQVTAEQIAAYVTSVIDAATYADSGNSYITGYAVSVSGNINLDGGKITVTVEINATGRNWYPVTVNNNQVNGIAAGTYSFSNSKNIGSIYFLEEGSTVTLTASANGGYELVSVTSDNAGGAAEGNTYSFIAKEGVVIDITWQELDVNSITVYSDIPFLYNGTGVSGLGNEYYITEESVAGTGGALSSEGSVVTAADDVNYYFLGWAVQSGSAYTFVSSPSVDYEHEGISYYAIWGYGGSNAIGSYEANGDLTRLGTATTASEGVTFYGWYSALSDNFAEEYKISDGAITGTIVYARWNYTLTVNMYSSGRTDLYVDDNSVTTYEGATYSYGISVPEKARVDVSYSIGERSFSFIGTQRSYHTIMTVTITDGSQITSYSIKNYKAGERFGSTGNRYLQPAEYSAAWGYSEDRDSAPLSTISSVNDDSNNVWIESVTGNAYITYNVQSES